MAALLPRAKSAPARSSICREAVKRDDMLFVASSGNNGTDNGQWLNFPSAYEGVLAVGAVNCRNEVQPWSQKNARVDVVAPGARARARARSSAARLERSARPVTSAGHTWKRQLTRPPPQTVKGADIISSYPTASAAKAGATAGYLALGGLSFNTAPGAYFSGLGAFKGALADCGTGDAPCPSARSAVCLVQAGVKQRTLPDGGVVPIVASSCSLAKFCVDAGAKAVVMMPPETIPQFGPYPRNVGRQDVACGLRSLHPWCPAPGRNTRHHATRGTSPAVHFGAQPGLHRRRPRGLRMLVCRPQGAQRGR